MWLLENFYCVARPVFLLHSSAPEVGGCSRHTVAQTEPLGMHLPLKAALCRYPGLSARGLCSHHRSCSAHIPDKPEAPGELTLLEVALRQGWLGRWESTTTTRWSSAGVAWSTWYTTPRVFHSNGSQWSVAWQCPVLLVSLPVSLRITSWMNYLHLRSFLWRNLN